MNINIPPPLEGGYISLPLGMGGDKYSFNGVDLYLLLIEYKFNVIL